MSHCCLDMQKAISLNCEQHHNVYSCPDVLISFNNVFHEYGIIIHDGGSASIAIRYCPWCGKKLPSSKRDLWFDTLESMGYDDPKNQEIPNEFKSGDWYIHLTKGSN